MKNIEFTPTQIEAIHKALYYYREGLNAGEFDDEYNTRKKKSFEKAFQKIDKAQREL